MSVSGAGGKFLAVRLACWSRDAGRSGKTCRGMVRFPGNVDIKWFAMTRKGDLCELQ